MLNEHLRISKHFLLSSPPGQFEVIFRDLNEILVQTRTPLTSEWKEKVLNEYNERTGRVALQSTSSNDDHTAYDEMMKQYLQENYSGRGVKSNYSIDSYDDGKTTTILLYAERIQLHQYHAGSWTARYTIVEEEGGLVTMSGKISLHAHTFENGNLQLRSTIDLAPISNIKKDDTTTIIKQIQAWDETSVMDPLRNVYENMSSDILKQLRRVMPVTRTRFDWNVAGHRGIRELGSQVQGQK